MPAAAASCQPGDHASPRRKRNRAACRKAAALFRALGDQARLTTLLSLADGEMCVTELAAQSQEGLSTVSQRLRLLRAERLVTQRREGKHIYYSLNDQHVADLIRGAIEHVQEGHHAS